MTAKINYSNDELTSKGMYPQEGTWYGAPYMPVERLSPPVSPADNILRYFRQEPVQWVPDILGDMIDITPDCNPDVHASGYEGGLDAFGVKWIPDESCPDLPAFVEPGFILLEDIEDWKKLDWPDVDSWNWKEDAQKYRKTYADDDRVLRGIILSSYFERLISIMGFENAAMAMIEDPETTSEFFAELAKVNMKIADHLIDDFGCKAIMIHDDWSAQRAPFFSPATCMEVIVPHLKTLVDHCHERGVIAILHSCGNGEALVPCMKAAGVDGWQAQDTALNMESTLAAIDNAFVFETYPTVPDGIQGEELEAFVRDNMTHYNEIGRTLLDFYDFDPERILETRRLTYKVGREMA